MEGTLNKVSKILNTVGWICFSIFLLFTIEVAFLFSSISIVLLFDQAGGAIEPILFFVRLHFFLIRFAFAMFILGILFWLFSEISKSNRLKRERFEQRRREAIVEVKEAVLDELKKSRRKK